MLRSYRIQILLLLGITILAAISVALPIATVRFVFILPVVFFVPGYLTLLALFPREDDMGYMERLLLGGSLSLAIEILLLLLLNYAWSLGIIESVISLLVSTGCIAVMAWKRLDISGAKNTRLFSVSSSGQNGFSLGKTFATIMGYRTLLWILLLGLTVALMIFPVQITLNPSPIQSIHVFASLPLFAAVFLTWMAVLLFLLFFSRGTSRNDWESLALMCVFAVGYSTFWTARTFFDQGGDSLSQLSLVNYLRAHGQLPDVKFGYFEYPGLFVLTNYLSQLIAMDSFSTAFILRIITPVLFVAMLFYFFKRLLGSGNFASVAVLLAQVSITGFRTNFRPDLIAYLFLMALLMILVREREKPFYSNSTALLFIILVAALTVSYFMHAAAMAFILFTTYLVSVWKKEEAPQILMIVLPFVLLLTWQMFWSTTTFTNVSTFIPKMVEQLVTGGIFNTAKVEAEITVSSNIPLWAVMTRYMKWGFFYALGTGLALFGFLHARKLASTEKLMFGGIFGSLLLTATVTVLSPSGSQFNRYFMYAFIFISPMILTTILKMRKTLQRVGLVLLLIFVFVQSLPSFLVNGAAIAGNVSIQEITAGEFLQRRYGSGNDLRVFANGSYGSDIVYYFLPDAEQTGTKEYKDLTAETVRKDVERVYTQFKSSDDSSIFVYNERKALEWYADFFVSPDDPFWQELKRELSGENDENVIFSNDYVHIYSRPAQNSTRLAD